MHSLRQYIAKHEAALAGIPFTYVVALPSVCFRVASPEWGPEQIIDQDKLARQTLPELLRQALAEIRKRLVDQPWFDGKAGKPDRGQCERLLERLRPSFEVVQSATLLRKQLDQELLHYTTQQMQALDAMADNPRVLFSGAAGTGKTVLAVEAARRAVLQGQRTLLLCFNRQLGEHLKEAGKLVAEDAPGRLWVGTMHAMMQQIVGGTPTAKQADSPDYWENALPERALGRLLESEATQADWQFDTLILDEAQDLLRPQMLDVLDLCLPSGLARSGWLMFGDFAQSLYNEHLYNFDDLGRHVPGITWVPYRLTNNCRNTPSIGQFVQKMARLQPRYGRYLRPDDHNLGDPELRYYSNEDGQVKLLAEILEMLLRGHTVAGDIVVLSSLAAGSAAARLATMPGWGNRLRPLGERQVGQAIRYSTVHAYKGLEAPVVVVTDIRAIDGSEGGALFYVAASRARNRLYLLIEENNRSKVLGMLIQPDTL